MNDYTLRDSRTGLLFNSLVNIGMDGKELKSSVILFNRRALKQQAMDVCQNIRKTLIDRLISGFNNLPAMGCQLVVMKEGNLAALCASRQHCQTNLRIAAIAHGSMEINSCADIRMENRFNKKKGGNLFPPFSF